MTSLSGGRIVADIATIDVRPLLTAPDDPEMAHITTAEIDALSLELVELDGGGTMFFASGTYCIQHLAVADPAQRSGLPLPGQPDHCHQGGIRIRPKVSYVGESGTLLLLWCDGIPVYKLDPDDLEEDPEPHPLGACMMSGAAPFVWNPELGTGNFVQAVIDENVMAGDLTFEVDTVTGFTTGKPPVMIRLDAVDGDSANVRWWTFANVDEATNSPTPRITLDRPAQIPCDVTGPPPSGPQPDLRSHVIMKVDPDARLDSIEISNFELAVHADANPPQGGIFLSYARNCRITNIAATDVGAGAVDVRYSQNTQVRSVFVKSASIPAEPDEGCPNAADVYGRGITLHAVHGARVADLRVEHFETDPMVVEQHSLQCQFENVYLMNNHDDRDQTAHGMVTSTEGSDVSVDGLTIEGSSGFDLVRADEEPHRLSITDLTVRPVRPVEDDVADGLTTVLRGGVRHDRVVDEDGSDVFVYYHDTPRVWSKAVRIPVDASVPALLRLPDGLIRRGRLYVSYDEGLTGLSIVNKGDSADVGVDLASLAQAGVTIDLPASVTTIGPDTVAEQQVDATSHEPEPRFLSVVTDDDMLPGQYLVIQLEYFPYRNPTSNDSRDDHDGGFVQGIDTLRSESVLVKDTGATPPVDVVIDLADHEDWHEVTYVVNSGDPQPWETSVAAKPGDVLQFAPNFTVGGSDATDVSFNVKCDGMDGNLWTAIGTLGYTGWRARSSGTGAARPVTGAVTYRVTSDDIQGGWVAARLMFRLSDASAGKHREIVVTNNQAPRIELINLGCP